MSIDENELFDEETDYDPKKHKRLVESIGRLGKTQHIHKPTRSEPVLKQDEFHLSKTGKISQVEGKHTSVSVNDLVNILNKTDKHYDIGKELKKVQRTKAVLPKPLEKPEADRIQRTIGYENAKKKLTKWDPVVAKNRLADHQVFPLDYEEIHVDTTPFSKKKHSRFSIKSDLQIEMEALEEKLKALKGIKKVVTDEKEEERKLQQKLTRTELIAKRKELTYLKIQQSQKSAKARLHNKIKSKKFHKLLKKEKLKEQLKQFELLQKTNPEAAMEQLDMLEKSRVLERANLRHKNTGTWAKNLQVRAKYDKDVRKDLSEQLAISRELTQKRHESTDDEEDKESDADEDDNANSDDEKVKTDPFNPWVKVTKTKEKDDEVLMSYKKYWLERNENEKLNSEYENQILLKEEKSKNSENFSEETSTAEFKEILNNQQNNKINGEKTGNENEGKRKSKVNLNNKKRQKVMENGWIVEEIDPTSKKNGEQTTNSKSELVFKDIDDIFDEAEDEMQSKLFKTAKDINVFLNGIKESKNKFRKKGGSYGEKDELKNLKDLSFKNEKQKPDLDEELTEVPLGGRSQEISNASISIKKYDNAEVKITDSEKDNGNNNITDLIDPNDFANIKPKRLHTYINCENPDSQNLFGEEVGDENEIDLELSRQMTIAEAFEDDDVVADFTKEKEDKNKKDTEIDLTMPGWGSWGGCGIKNQKKKRLVLKFPEKEKRRDDNKGNLYINENANKLLKEHLVSDLPFPFTSVKDYEASIRAPIGRTFVPETAFRILTRPAVQTKMGQIIEPIDESILVKKPFVKRKHIVDKRIEKMLKKEDNIIK